MDATCVVQTALLAAVLAVSTTQSFPLFPTEEEVPLGNARINASATCGPGDFFNSTLCNTQYYDPRNALNDTLGSFWLSSRLGPLLPSLYLEVDLLQPYHVSELSVRAGPTSHPIRWLVQGSEDGVLYKTWIAFVTNITDCTSGNVPYLRNLSDPVEVVGESETVCTDEAVSLRQLQELTPWSSYRIPLRAYRKGAANLTGNNQQLLMFLKARYIRLVFIHQSATELTVSPPTHISISGLRLRASCACGGFASSCIHLPGGGYRCDCEGNTCGGSCEECCPLFNDQPYDSFEDGFGEVCGECDCNSRARSCHFDLTVNSSVCNNCENGTAGPHCEGCADGYYRPPGTERGQPCQACDCVNSIDGGRCDENGQCVCLSGFGGLKCDVSSICDASGSCRCKPGVGGRNCTSCLPGYWGLSPDGCQPCNCNGNGTDPDLICDPTTGVCLCAALMVGDDCSQCNTSRVHIVTEEGCQVCGDCVDRLTNVTTLLITMLNQTLERLPNLTIRIGPLDLDHVARNSTYIGRFLDIWTGNVGTIEVALGLAQGPPLNDGSFSLLTSPPLLDIHTTLKTAVFNLSKFEGLDQLGDRVVLRSNRTFYFSMELSDRYAELELAMLNLTSHLETHFIQLDNNSREMTRVRMIADGSFNVVKNRNYRQKDTSSREDLATTLARLKEASTLREGAERLYTQARSLVEKFFDQRLDKQLQKSIQWTSDVLRLARESVVVYDLTFSLYHSIMNLLPQASSLSEKSLSALVELEGEVTENEDTLMETDSTYQASLAALEAANNTFQVLEQFVRDYERQLQLLQVVPHPRADPFEGKGHAEALHCNGTTIQNSSAPLRMKVRLFLDELSPTPVVQFSTLSSQLQDANQQALLANLTLSDARLSDLSIEVSAADLTAASLVQRGEDVEDTSRGFLEVVRDVEMRYDDLRNWSVVLEGEVVSAMTRLEAVEAKPSYDDTFASIAFTTATSDSVLRGTDSVLDDMSVTVPSVQKDINTTLDNIDAIKGNIDKAEFTLGCIQSQTLAAASAMGETLTGVDELMRENDDIISEIDDIIKGLASVHGSIQRNNAPVNFDSQDGESPFLSLQPPPGSQPEEPVLFESIDLYLIPQEIPASSILLFYAGPAWNINDPNYNEEQDQETYIALTASENKLTFHWKLRSCNKGDSNCTSLKDSQLHPMGALVEVAQNHIQIVRVGNQLRLIRRTSLTVGDTVILDLDGDLLFVPNRRTVYYLGGQPGDVRIHSKVNGFGSYAGVFNLLLYNKALWGLWNTRHSSNSDFSNYLSAASRRNSLVQSDISDREVLSFDGGGYLFAEHMATHVARMQVRGQGRTEMVFHIRPQSKEGMVMYAFDQNEQVSLELAYVQGIISVSFRAKDVKETLMSPTTFRPFQLKLTQVFIGGPNPFAVKMEIDGVEGNNLVVFLPAWFRNMADARAWFGGYPRNVASTVHTKLCDNTSYVPSVDGFFRGSIYIQMRPANRMTTLNVFSSALEDFKRFYINSPVQRAVSRTEYATSYARELGLNSTEGLRFTNVELKSLIAITDITYPAHNDFYAISFRASHLNGGLLFQALNHITESNISMFLDEQRVKVQVAKGDDILLLSSRVAMETERWYSVFVRVTLDPEAISTFQLYIDNELADSVSGLKDWLVHTEANEFVIPSLTIGGATEGGHFQGCLKDFVIKKNPFDFFTPEDLDPSQGRPRLGVDYYECPGEETPRPLVTTASTVVALDDLCVPLERVREEVASVGAFYQDTVIKTANVEPFLESTFHIQFSITLSNDGGSAVPSLDGTRVNNSSVISGSAAHILSLSSKRGEVVSLFVVDTRQIVMVVSGRDGEAEVQQLNVSRRSAHRLFCSSVDGTLECALDHLSAVKVAQRTSFDPVWPVVFGRASAEENAMKTPFDSFVGCMDELRVSGNASVYSGLQTGLPCFRGAPAYYLDGTSYIIVNGSEKATFSFTPLRKNGLLAAILLQQQDGPYGVVYALGLNKGVLQASGPANPYNLSMECGNRGNLTIEFTVGMVTVVFCDEVEDLCGPSWSTPVVATPGSTTLYIGGIPAEGEYTNVDDLTFLKAATAPRNNRPPNFVGVVHPPLPPTAVLIGTSLGPAP